MSQVIFTPNGVYKYFRNLVIGHTGAGSETDGFYVNKAIGTTAVKKLAYFKVGIGGPDPAELTREFYDANCLNENSGKGDLNTPIHIYATAIGYGSSRDKKALVSANFTPYGSSNDSKVAGVLSVVANAGTEYWNKPGVFFQLATALSSGEGNYDGSGTLVVAPDVVNINEIGIFDEDDIMILYAVFPPMPKNNTLSLKVNNVAMQKILDYQLILTTTTTVI